MSVVASKVRGFLIQMPKPAAVRVTGDGEPQTLKPGKSYAKLAESIEALGVDLVEALDKEGTVLRAMRLGTVEAQRSSAADIPEGLKADPNALMLTHFANLIHRAYEHSTEVAFSKLVELQDKLNDRSENIERRLERSEADRRALLQQQVDDAFEQAAEVAARAAQEGEGGDLLSQMGQAFLSGRMQQQPNGKGKVPNPSNGSGGH